MMEPSRVQGGGPAGYRDCSLQARRVQYVPILSCCLTATLPPGIILSKYSPHSLTETRPFYAVEGAIFSLAGRPFLIIAKNQ